MASGPLNSAPNSTSILVGGTRNVTAPAPADGQDCALQLDASGNLKVSIGAIVNVTPNVNIAQIGGVAEALTNPLPVELSDGTQAFGVNGNPVFVAEAGSTTGNAPANTSVTSVSSAILALNSARREVIIVNTDVVTIYIGLGQVPTATAYHFALKPCGTAHDGTGGSFISDTWKGAVNAIVASTSGHVAITELT